MMMMLSHYHSIVVIHNDFCLSFYEEQVDSYQVPACTIPITITITLLLPLLLLLIIIIIMIMRLLLIPQKQDQKGGNMISLPPCGYDFLKKKTWIILIISMVSWKNMELYALYMQCIAYPTYIYIYIPLICQLHTIYKLKIYINHLRFYVIFHNYLPLTLMWPRQIHTHIYIYTVYI